MVIAEDLEKQKGLARKVESVKDTQATDLNALSENNDRPVFDDSQRGVMAILVAVQTQSNKGGVSNAPL